LAGRRSEYSVPTLALSGNTGRVFSLKDIVMAGRPDLNNLDNKMASDKTNNKLETPLGNSIEILPSRLKTLEKMERRIRRKMFMLYKKNDRKHTVLPRL